MPRNIVIFSDGTGQRSGVLFDESRSNIYKLYRACRTGPDSSVDPRKQFAYYDAGIGTKSHGESLFSTLWKRIYNVVSQATGFGLTGNIIDCYAEIIRNWQKDDRIYLFGFSRGAYTVRCVAAVIALCGVPQREMDGSPLKRSQESCRKLAKYAVKKIYQHVSSPKDEPYKPQRAAMAEDFRRKVNSDVNGGPNALPHFIGVFDTVASVANLNSLIVVGLIWLVSGLVLVGALAWTNVLSYFGLTFGTGVVWYAGLSLALGLLVVLSHNVKWATGLKDYTFWQTLHRTSPRLRFPDTQLNTGVGWARHALAIDEDREDFDRVPWTNGSDAMRTVQPSEPEWFKQIWFAGCHSDIGGSYPESESRLSDIALQWMLDEARAVPDPLVVDTTVLRLYPHADGVQHDETRSWTFRLAKRIRLARQIPRQIPPNAPLHPSVVERFGLAAVLHGDLERPYRPESLKGHVVAVLSHKPSGLAGTGTVSRAGMKKPPRLAPRGPSDHRS